MKLSKIKTLLLVAVVSSLIVVPGVLAGHAAGGADVKVTDDNNNVDGGLANVTPSKDAQNRQSNEPTVAISGVASPLTGQVGDIVAAAANDYRMVPHFGDAWMPVYLSFNGGANWFGPNGYNTMVPGFPTDTSAAGLSSPLKNLDGSGDPVVRFDAAGNLYIAGIAFNRNFDQPDRPVDTVAYVAKYNFTSGTPATASTKTTAGSPPHFTYAGTTIVDRGEVELGYVDDVVYGPIGLIEVAVESDAGDVQVARRVEPNHRVARPIEVLDRRAQTGSGRVGREARDHGVVARRKRRGPEPGCSTIEGEVDRHPGVAKVRDHAIIIRRSSNNVTDLTGQRRGRRADGHRGFVGLAVLSVLARRHVCQAAVNVVVVVGDFDVHASCHMARQHAWHDDQARYDCHE